MTRTAARAIGRDDIGRIETGARTHGRLPLAATLRLERDWFAIRTTRHVDAPRVERTVRIDTAKTRWHSTGRSAKRS